jgi:2-succinyl-5-enolpyruvyl-6-hydroxy-3-cyclohexene-1-carboxylate synthase
VHLNLPFRKPLEPVQLPSGHRDHVPEALLREAALPLYGRRDGSPWSKLHIAASSGSVAAISRLCQLVDRASRPLIIAGADAVTTADRVALRDFAAHRNIPLLAEPTSGIRHWSARGEHVIAAADTIIESGFYQQHGWPDMLIRLGRAPLLWTTQGMLSQLPAHCHHLQIGRSLRRADPLHQLAEQIVCDPAELFAAASAQAIDPALSATRRRWLQAHQQAQHQGLAALQAGLTAASGELTAPGLWHEIGAVLPDGAALFVASSMAVRNLDSFMCMHANDLQVYFNAGLNGIDGIVSTAMGVAAAQQSGADLPAMPTVLVIGDVALRHDVGALLLAAELGIDLTVIVIDNNGGEIFEYLPSAGYGAVHDKHFATVDRTATSGMLPRAVELHTVTDWAQFRALLKDCLCSSGLQVLRVPTRRINDRRLRDALRQQAAAAQTAARPVSN